MTSSFSPLLPVWPLASRPIRTLRRRSERKSHFRVLRRDWWVREKGQRSEVRGSTHPRPGRRAERPGEGERSRTAPSAEEESDEPRPERRKRGQSGALQGKLCRKEEVEGRVCWESEEDRRFRNATPENYSQTEHTNIKRPGHITPQNHRKKILHQDYLHKQYFFSWHSSTFTHNAKKKKKLYVKIILSGCNCYYYYYFF